MLRSQSCQLTWSAVLDTVHWREIDRGAGISRAITIHENRYPSLRGMFRSGAVQDLMPLHRHTLAETARGVNDRRHFLVCEYIATLYPYELLRPSPFQYIPARSIHGGKSAMEIQNR